MIKRDYNLKQFKEYVADKKCICVGAGLQGLHIIYLFENWGLSSNILVFADNNPDKWNTLYEVENYSYPIVSIKKAIEFVDENVVIIITCADVVGITKQLEEYDELNKVTYFSLAEIAQMQLLASDYNQIIKESETELIPKRIHYCWFGKEMPKAMRDNVERWRFICPDYEFFEWNDNNYDIKKVAYMSEAYDERKWGFVPDYIRLDVIYRYGGIYMDTDVKLLKKPDELLKQRGFAISDGSFFMNLGAGFGAMPENSMIREFRDYYENIHFKNQDGKLDLTACQIHQYRVLRKYNIQLLDVLLSVKDINIFPMIMASTNTYSMQMRLSEKAFFAHYGVASWMNDEHMLNKKKMHQKEIKGLMNYTMDVVNS